LDTTSSYFYIIVLAIFLTLLTNFGLNNNILEPLLFLKTNLNTSFGDTYFIHHEWWRLIAPSFLHFSITHLLFNCLWIFILGSRIERLDGLSIFLFIFILSGILSNAGQFFWTQQYLFGGLSGSIYGLLGYCFIVELGERHRRYDIPEALYLFMFIWLLVGFSGILSFFGFGMIANIAHLAGLFCGFILGFLNRLFQKT
jgi:GlpG protein